MATKNRKPRSRKQPAEGDGATLPAKAPPLRLEWRDASELADNPRNWRRHPESQLAALEGAIAEVGWAGACLYNERTGRLIDGHARRKVALKNGGKVPVLVGDWDEATEAKILATLDPLAGMATADPAALDQLLREVNTGCAELQQLLDDVWENAQADAIADTVPADGDVPDSSYVQQYGVTVICRDESHQQQVYERLTGEGLECKVVVT